MWRVNLFASLVANVAVRTQQRALSAVAMATHLAVDNQATLSTVPTVITSAGDEQNTTFGQTDSLISEVAKSSALPPDTTAASQSTVIATGIMTTNESTSQEMPTTRVDDLQNFSTAVESTSDGTSSDPASSSVTETINVNMTSLGHMTSERRRMGHDVKTRHDVIEMSKAMLCNWNIKSAKPAGSYGDAAY